MQIADEAIVAGISPRPAKTVIQKKKRLAFLKLDHWLGIGRRPGTKRCGLAKVPLDGLGIMRGDHSIGERGVGKVLSVGVETRVRQVRGSFERELLSGGGRMRALAR